MKEKLTAILSDYFKIGDSYHYTLGRDKEAFGMGTMGLDDFTEYGEETIAELVDHLLANGVTVQEWIPTAERMPTEADADAHGLVMTHSKIGTNGEAHLFVVVGDPDFYTHWMSYPKPPKKDKHKEEKKMKREDAIKTAAKWWTDKLRQRAPHDNGDNSPANQFAMMLADMLTTPMSEDQLNRFQEALEKEIAADLERHGWSSLGCDYGPCIELANAADQAGINTSNFPYKTHMHIRQHGKDNYTVQVADGYGKPFVEVKPCE